ncbi:MAG: glycosyltransferase [Pseudomonadota bacterium]
MNILFTTPILEHPPAGGPQLRIENSIKALSRVGKLYIISRASRLMIGGQAAEDFYRSYAQDFRYAPSCVGHCSNRYIRKAQRVFGGVTGLDAERDCAYILRCVDEWKIDVVWLGYGNISFPLIKKLRAARPNLKLVCDTDSIWSRFVLRELPYIKNSLRKLLVARRGRAKEIEERKWVELCDVTTGVSEVDCAYYRTLTKDVHKVQQFSNVIDLDTYSKTSPEAEALHKPYIYLAGTFGHANSPMDKAARWMLDEVMPLVRKSLPDLHFYIVGSGSDMTLGHETNANVTVTGKLKSVLPYLCYADVSVVPLKFESGTRFKILEAAACDIPIVSTILGAEGIPAENEKHLLLADSAEDFAQAIVKLVNDRAYAKQLAKSCKEMVYKEFSIDTLEKEAKDILEYIAKCQK